MNREAITQICEQEVLEPAARLFATSREALIKFAPTGLHLQNESR